MKREISYTISGNVNWCNHTHDGKHIVRKLLKKLKIELPYDPAIPLLGIYPKKPQKYQFEEIYAPPCSLQHYLQYTRYGSNPSVHWWTDLEEELYRYAMECYLVKKKNEILSFTTRMDLEGIMLGETNQTKTSIIWFHLYVESKKQINIQTKQRQRQETNLVTRVGRDGVQVK